MGVKLSEVQEDIKLDHYLLKEPRKLTIEQKRILAHRVMKKHGVAAITLHWVNAICWLILIPTGAALISADYIQFVPDWFIRMMATIFGTKGALLHFHIMIGVFWLSTLLVYGIFGFKNYLLKFVHDDLVFYKDDLKWFITKLSCLLGKIEPHECAPQGPYNAGQKAYAVVVAFSTVTLIITGPIMAFHLGSANVIRWAMLLHFIATMSIVAGLFVHVYMAAIFPEERPAFFSMITGKVNELYAYLHHYKWWVDVKMKEHAFLREEYMKDGLTFDEAEQLKKL